MAAGTMSASPVADLEELLKASKRVRRPLEPQWFLNVAFYLGKQWVEFDGWHLHEPDLEEWRAKLVDNRIQPVVRTEIAKMTKSRPVWVGVPRTSDDEDLASARLAERVLEWQWKNLSMLAKLRSALLWSRVCGAGFWKVSWDPEAGDSTDVLVNADGRPVQDQSGAPMRASRLGELPAGYAEEHGVSSRRVAMGDVRLDVRTPFEMFVDPLAGEEGLDSAGWLIEEAVYSRQYVYDHFPQAAELGVEPDSDASGGITESRMPGRVLGISDSDVKKHGITLREYWCRPNAEHPQGKRIVWTKSGHVLHDDGNSYPWLPYVMFRGVPVPGRFWPTSVTEQLISPQTELNKVESQIAENGERIGNPPLLRSSINADFDWHGLPGETIDFQDVGTEGSIPRFMDVPELPGYVQNRLGQIESSIREISGQHEVTSGSVPAGVTAASAINLLQEQDDTRLGPDIADMEDALAGAGRRVIWLVGSYWSDNRMLRVAGDDGRWDFKTYRRGMLKGDQGVEVQAGSGMPQSRAAKQAALQEVLNMLVQSKVPLSESSLRRIMQEYEIGGLEQFFSTVGEDERQVDREHQRMLAGQGAAINEWDDDEAHITGHQRFMKSASFEEQDERIMQLFVEHLEMHKLRKQQQAVEMAQLQLPIPPSGDAEGAAAAPGVPPAPPVPPAA